MTAARPRVTHPAPAFEHAPSPSAGQTPATGSSDTGARRDSSIPRAASVSVSHERLFGSNSPVPLAVDTLVRSSPVSFSSRQSQDDTYRTASIPASFAGQQAGRR